MRYTVQLTFLIIIVTLVGWLVYEITNERERNLNLSTTLTLKMAIDLLDRENGQLLAEIEKRANEYESHENEDYKARAVKVRRLCAQNVYNIQNLAHLVHENKISGGEVFSKVKSLIDQYRDSLLFLTNGEVEEASLPNLMLQDPELSVNWLQGYVESAIPNEIQLILRNIIARVKSTEMTVLNHFYGKVSGAGTIVCFPGPVIGVSPLNPTPKVGDLYSAEIFAYMYERPKSRNVRILVDGKELEIKDEVGHFRQRYNTPGVKKYRAEIIFTNPVTKQQHSFKKEFSVTVVDTCR